MRSSSASRSSTPAGTPHWPMADRAAMSASAARRASACATASPTMPACRLQNRNASVRSAPSGRATPAVRGDSSARSISCAT